MTTVSIQNRPQSGIIPNPILGMMIFIGTEIMFFSALISAYLVIRSGAFDWPPPDQPRLPVLATAFNTAILLLSWVALYTAGKFSRNKFNHLRMRRLIGVSILLGTFFVLFQGYEWVQMVGFGLTMASSVYGALFYLIIGSHAVHVAAALGFLVFVWIRTASNSKNEFDLNVFEAAKILWTFVVGIWPLLYYLVYLK